jgi:hypothetical protein
MLKWNVQARPPAQAAVAGRRADASRSRGGAGTSAVALESDAQQYSAGFTSRYDAQEQQRGHSSSRSYASGSARQQTPPDAAGYDAAGYGSSSSSSRPPSQQLTEGLSKLKQLSTARLATRLTTPPTNSVYGGGCGQRQHEPAGAGFGGSSSSSSHRRTTSGGRCCSNAGTLHQQQQQQGWAGNDSSGYTLSNYTPSSGVQQTASRGQQSMAGASLLAQAAVNGSGKTTASRGGARSDAGFAASPAAAAAVAQYEAPVVTYSQAPGEDEYGSAAELQQCGNCGRSFVASALQRHAKVCAKVFCQKRKVRGWGGSVGG